ncbi:MAG: amidohydrolase family protein [Wenzhouxiangellaceae bacterium]
MRYAFIVLCALLTGPLHAAELRQPLPGTYAIVDVRVVPAPGEVLESATVVIRDGVIEAVGRDIQPPPDATVVTFERDEEQPPITVYAGLIDPYLVVASDAESDENGNDHSDGEDEDTESVPGRHPLIRAGHRFDAAAWPGEKVDAHRRAGFTTALIAPGAGLLRGNSLLANLGDGGMSANLLAENVAQHARLDERSPDGNYPQSLMGSVALFRQSLLDAGWQQSARNAWQANPAQSRPEWLAGVDALGPVLAGEQPLVFEAKDTLDSLRILDLVPGDIDLVLVGHGEEYKRLDDFDRQVPHILPLDFPSAPDVEDQDNGDDNGQTNRDVSLEELRHWKFAPENPARMIDAGFPLLLTAHGQSNPADLFGQIAKAVEHGLDADTALAALTTGPAEWLGIADRAGRVAEGYMANLVLVEGELFGDETSISEVWVDGHRFELTKLTPPEVDPAGTWELTLGLEGMGDVDATLTLSGKPANMDGTLMVMGNETPLSEARVSGKQLQVRIDASRLGGSGTISINMDIEGDRGRGNGSGPFGEFTVRGKKSSGPGDEETRI